MTECRSSSAEEEPDSFAALEVIETWVFLLSGPMCSFSLIRCLGIAGRRRATLSGLLLSIAKYSDAPPLVGPSPTGERGAEGGVRGDVQMERPLRLSLQFVQINNGQFSSWHIRIFCLRLRLSLLVPHIF